MYFVVDFFILSLPELNITWLRRPAASLPHARRPHFATSVPSDASLHRRSKVTTVRESAERMALSHATPVASMRHSSHESDALQAQTGTQTAHQHALRGGIEFA
jgi:hypothetical protein